VRLAPCGVEHLDQRGQVRAVAANLEDRLAAVSVQRLDYDLAMLGQELAGDVERARDQRGRQNRAKSSTQTFSGALRTSSAGR
jgi:hypothetical protein